MEKELKPLHDLKKRSLLIDTTQLNSSDNTTVSENSAIHPTEPSVTQTPTVVPAVPTSPQPVTAQKVAPSVVPVPVVKPPENERAAVVHSTVEKKEQQKEVVIAPATPLVPETVVAPAPIVPETENIAASKKDEKPFSRLESSGAVAANIGTSEYRLTSEQKMKLTFWLFLVAILGGIFGLIFAVVISLLVYRKKSYTVVNRIQYKDIAISMLVANLAGAVLFGLAFGFFDFFQVKLAGYYFLSILLTLCAQALVGFAKTAELNHQADYQRLED